MNNCIDENNFSNFLNNKFQNKNNFQNKFFDIKNYLLNNELLYIFYCLIKADYNFYNQCIGIIEGTLSLYFKNYFIIPRGSYTNKTSIKNSIDLDLDLILPREFINPEEINVNQYPQLLNKLNQYIMNLNKNNFNINNNNNKIILKNLNKKLTRSLEYLITIEGIEISVDLFPKLISKDGKLVNPSHRLNDQGERYWEYNNLSNRVETLKFNDCQIASIIFLKLYKKDLISCHPIIFYLKGYHLCLSIDKILEKSFKNERNMVEFNIENVFSLMNSILEYLMYAYDRKRLRDINFISPYGYKNQDYIFDENIDPFIEDTDHINDADIQCLINNIINLKDIILPSIKQI